MNILSLIGNTPMVELSHLHSNPNVKIYAKLEGQNPGGSVKDRPALNMIKMAIKSGVITKQTKVVEATSGNTGIGLAMVANIYGLKMTLVMPDNATAERVKTMKAYGATVVLTPAEKTIEYAREYAQKLVDEQGYFMFNQFANDDNWKAHYKSTGPEIWKDTSGQITHFVSAMGTTGTIMGVSTYLKEQNHQIQIVGVQPSEGARIPGIRRWSPEFLPKIFDAQKVDQIIDVSQEEATQTMQKLAQKESIFAGKSSGGAVAAALRLSHQIKEGLIVCIVPDRGDRYLSEW